jgi:TRAP-type uncharacterized transport system substrate-binding protein
MIDKKLNEEAVFQMKKALELNIDNVEKSHMNADEILCQVLQALGYKELVDIYIEIDKWYS